MEIGDWGLENDKENLMCNQNNNKDEHANEFQGTENLATGHGDNKTG